MIYACLSHDIDRIDKTYQHLTKPLKAILKGDFVLFLRLLRNSFFIRRPYWGFDTIMDIERKYGVRSTFFFLNESIPFKLLQPHTWKLSMGRYSINDQRIIRIIKELDGDGWEIGLHGSYRSYKSLELLYKEKKQLEQILGHEVCGIRQHYLNIDNNTWENQRKCGFKYDSSWGWTNQIGFKEGRIMPFFPLDDDSFCVIPLSIMDSSFSETENKWQAFDELLQLADRNNSFLVINYHNNNFSNSEYLNYNGDYIHIIERLREYGASFITLTEAYHAILHSKR